MPMRRADEDLFVLEVERAFEGVRIRAGDLGCFDPVGGVLEQDSELVAAEAGAGVGGPQARLQPFADLAEQEIAGRMTERVVDRLEVVEIHEQHGDGLAVPGLTFERVLRRGP